MKQLSGLDAAFIHQESPKTPMHVSPVLIYGPHTGSSSSLDIAAIRQAFSDSLPEAPILTQKLLSLPLRMDEPYWVTDKRFNVEQHVSECELPAPGSWAQLKVMLARLHAEGLNMEKPLWHATFITGLNNIPDIPEGSSALMLKIHHAAIDGVSLARLIAALHDEKPEDQKSRSVGQQGGPDPMEMWSRANLKNWTRPIKLVNTVSKLIPAVSKMRELETPEALSSTTKHSKTRFNAAVTRGRVIGSLQIPLQDLKAIKRGVRRVTLNDIAMGIVGGALREYLNTHGELPKASMVCGAPVNLRSKDDGTVGNKIATMQVGLATDIADPVERLRAVHQYALMGKAKISTLGTGTVMDISDSVAPGVLAEGLRALSFASTRVSEIPVPFHVMISNVPGPPASISLHGAPLYSLLGLGPIRHSMGLFHVVSNTAEVFTITFTSCRSIMPDSDFYEQCLQESFTALLEASTSADL
ncbi:MAG: wax ester/triacylglycerol synthase family O-acyltransferase [Halioglobus sp.]